MQYSKTSKLLFVPLYFIRYTIFLFSATLLISFQSTSLPSPSTSLASIDSIPKSELYVPAQQISKGPNKHWFGYYDKLQSDPTGRYVLSMEVDFEHRSPTAEDQITIGMIDLQNQNQWIELGTSKAWSWQQGCMLQFIPGSPDEIIWNDRQGDKFVCHILNIHTKAKRTLPFAIYTLSPDGKTAMGVNFERINDLRRGYGYAGVPDHNHENIAPANAGIYRCDLVNGTQQLVITLEQMMHLPLPENRDPAYTEDYWQRHHWFNHLLFNTDGTRFIFLHRWKSSNKGAIRGFGTLMYTATPDGKDLRLVDSSGFTSHFIWKDPNHILAWTRHPSHGDAFYLFEDRAYDQPQGVGIGVMTKNGHCTYLPGNKYILNDTYPDKQTRMQSVYLYDVEENKRIDVGAFYLDPQYQGEWRTDTHPRFIGDGNRIIIDCPVGSAGRQLILMDISKLKN